MNCPACQRTNHPRRRYCGGCGCNFAPACDACGFANDRADRFCGGCGQGLRAAAGAERPAAERAAAGMPSRAPAAAPPAVAPAPGPWDPSELAALFTPAAPVEEIPELPDSGISQNDVDRLFGGAS